ncbi:MAG: hypothetical protein IJY27_01615 [Clostridia bacterium]|nr:hypothetical protein [Clostridia bacterium]
MQACYDAPAGRPRGAFELYNSQGYRLKVILAWLLIILLGMMLYVGASAAVILADLDVDSDADLSRAIDTSLIGAIVLFVLPAVCGINSLIFRLSRGEEVYVTSIFSAYKNLPRTWLIMLLCLSPAILAGGVIGGAVYAWRTVAEFALMQSLLPVRISVYAAITVAAVAGLFFAARLALRMFLLPAYAFRGDMSLGRALVRSFCAASGRMWRTVGFILSYTGWFVLDCLTLGVLFIIHTAPHFGAAYMIFSDISLERVNK